MAGGKDASSPRYIFTRLAALARHVFNKADDCLLTYLNEEGLDIEPEWCVQLSVQLCHAVWQRLSPHDCVNQYLNVSDLHLSNQIHADPEVLTTYRMVSDKWRRVLCCTSSSALMMKSNAPSCRYMPILPLVLLNGAEGIGTGWSTSIPNYNPRDVVANVKALLAGQTMTPMQPWYKVRLCSVASLEQSLQ